MSSHAAHRAFSVASIRSSRTPNGPVSNGDPHRTGVVRTLRFRIAVMMSVVLGGLTSPARGDEPNPEGVSLARANPTTGIVQNTLNAFAGFNLALHATGIAATPVLVFSGADTKAHNAFARRATLEPYSVVGVYLGYGLPLLVGGGLATVGFASDSQREIVAASAAIQATALALGYQSVLKAFTGRPAPPSGVQSSNAASEEFRFGFLRGGIHYGWPSGHMMTTTAIFASLVEVYPDSLALQLGGGTVLAGMFGSVAIHEGSSMHWLSDMVAGTLMGYAIGRGVGAGFAGLSPKAADGLGQLSIGPLCDAPGARGINVRGTF